MNRTKSPVVELLAQQTIDKGITDKELIIEKARELYTATQDPEVKKYTYKRLTLKRAWSLRKDKFQSGIYVGKKTYANRDTTKHTVKVLTGQGYVFKFPNNLDFIHNLIKVHKIKTFAEFSRIVTEQDANFIPQYGRMQIEAMLEYGHLGSD